MSLKNQVTTPGIDPGTVRLVVPLGKIRIKAIPKLSISGTIQNAEFPEVGRRWWWGWGLRASRGAESKGQQIGQPNKHFKFKKMNFNVSISMLRK